MASAAWAATVAEDIADTTANGSDEVVLYTGLQRSASRFSAPLRARVSLLFSKLVRDSYLKSRCRYM